MDEKDCQMLVFLEEEPNITKTAERLYTSQPALAYRIRQIEEEFNITFFQRDGRKTALTDEALYLVQHAKKQRKLLKETKDKLWMMQEPGAGFLRIGVTNYFCHYIFPSLLAEFHQKHANIKYYVKSGMSSEMFSQLQDGTIDIAIIRGDFYWGGEKELLDEEDIGIVSNELIPMEELPYRERISFQEPDYLSYYPNQTKITIENFVHQWWQEYYQEQPNTVIEVNNYATCVRMVEQGLGYAIVPEFFLDDRQGLHFSPLVFKDGTKATRRTWLYYRNQQDGREAVATFAAFIKEYYGLS
ncbi:LysR family transcriptional regulator [Salibacterium aidingense]|uniref:LysR family transcriptional regulator n=1 Tax=Salibacterium aidingense TaxID=384933 RepID=UPI003BBE9837